MSITEKLKTLESALTARTEALDQMSNEIREVEKFLDDKGAPEYLCEELNLSFQRIGKRKRGRLVVHFSDTKTMTLGDTSAQVRKEYFPKLDYFLEKLLKRLTTDQVKIGQSWEDIEDEKARKKAQRM